MNSNTEVLGTRPPMPLRTAQVWAEKLKEWLLDRACEAVEVAGSVRRLRPSCNDIDLVVVPQYVERKDLFGEVISRESVLGAFLRNYVRADSRARWLRGAEGDSNASFSFLTSKCQVDIWCTTPETFGTVLLCRTGSKEHNIWLAQRALRMGGHWNPHHSLHVAGKRCPITTEQQIYESLGLPFIQPVDRELHQLRKFDQRATS